MIILSSAGAAGRDAPGSAALPRLHVIVGDEELALPDFGALFTELVRAGAGRLAVHLRAREMSAARLFAFAKAAVEVGRAADALIIVNDRLDVALAAGAGGVHLRADSLDPDDVARVVAMVEWEGRRLVVGRSIHVAEYALGLLGADVDYLVLGSIYETPSHPGGRVRGPHEVDLAVLAADVPVLAIGGVGVGRVAGLLARGAYGVVVKSGVWGAPDPAEAVTRYLEVLSAGG